MNGIRMLVHTFNFVQMFFDSEEYKESDTQDVH